jgi:hypothetical protein
MEIAETNRGVVRGLNPRLQENFPIAGPSKWFPVRTPFGETLQSLDKTA